ncbi:COG0603 Predicted PP-loop superfamily ATPase [uncultured Caudovirales phage]|uniref:7-cyano-7-deazaguanine synthase n=1 Tax=uncultured Caudovirales phage TaxID=2100421 RepID=A0A6J5LWS6_9CAUD|nr:COG0603 Predicted PP-loop superfamily ATPase [uncultured Caudovirales phage]
MRSIVVHSGGLDSSVILTEEVATFGPSNVLSIGFDYGQRHRKELAAAQALCKHLGCERREIDISSLSQVLKGSALTDAVSVPHGHYAAENMKLTIVPNRNAIMANIAIAAAVSFGCDRVCLGIHAGDHAIYPDCRPEFLDAMNRLAEIANDHRVEIVAPILRMNKAEVVAIGIRNGTRFDLTWTCYEGGDAPCGKCGSCVERAEAFAANGISDPLVSQS